MPIDEFDLSPDLAADPLDVSGFGGTPTLVPQQQKAAKPNFRDFAPLLAILPVVAQRGGMGGIAALMKGLQDARASKQQQGRVSAQDERAAAQQQSLNQYRQDQVNNQNLQRRQQFMGQFGTALGNVDDPEAVKALIDFYGGQAQDFGVDRPALEQFAMQSATPDRLMTRKVSKRWEKMSPAEKQLAQQTQASLVIDGRKLTYQEWSPFVGGMVDEKTGAYPQAPAAPAEPKPETRSLDVQAAEALARGDTATYQRLLRVKKEIGQADDRTPAQIGERPLTQNQRANIIGSRRSQWTRFTKAVVDRQSSIAKVDAGLAALGRGNRNAATQAIIIAFNKLQDETSVVREGEYARSEQLVPLINRIEGALQRITLGGASMTDADLRALAAEAKATAQALEAVTQEAAANLRQGIEEELSDYGIPTSRVFGASSVGTQKAAPQQAAPKAAPKIEAGRTYNHPQLGRVRVVGTNPDGTVKVEKVQ